MSACGWRAPCEFGGIFISVGSGAGVWLAHLRGWSKLSSYKVGRVGESSELFLHALCQD